MDVHGCPRIQLAFVQFVTPGSTCFEDPVGVQDFVAAEKTLSDRFSYLGALQNTDLYATLTQFFGMRYVILLVTATHMTSYHFLTAGRGTQRLWTLL